MVKDHSDSERGNTLPPLLGIVYMHYPTDRIAHTTAFVTPVGNTGWNEKYLNVSTMKDRSDDPLHHERTLFPRSYISHHLGP